MSAGRRTWPRWLPHGPGLVAGVAVTAVALAGTACSLVFQRPTLRVADVRLASMDLRGGTLAVALQIDNPNRFSLESQDFSYRLFFLDAAPGDTSAGGQDAWVKLADGRLSEPTSVPAHGTGTVTVNVPFDFASVGLAAGRLLRQGELEYRFSGELLFHTPLGGKRLPFDERGRFRP
jgi:LEA14-like dessication related protein